MDRLHYKGELYTIGYQSFLYKNDEFPNMHISIVSYGIGLDIIVTWKDIELKNMESTLRTMGWDLDVLLYYVDKMCVGILFRFKIGRLFDKNRKKYDIIDRKSYDDPIYDHLCRLANPVRP